jgi:superfamily I DNA/RNA helicase
MSKSLNDQYDPAARWEAVVAHESGTFVVNAGPGTGKTWSLIQKIRALLAKGVNAKHIYYLTFVNSIVEAFSADVAKPVDDGGLGKTVDQLGIQVCTLHSLAFKVLRTHHKRLSLPAELTMVPMSSRAETPSSAVIFEDLGHLVQCDGRRDLKRAIERIARVWQEGKTAPADLQSLEDAFATLREIYHVLPWDVAVPLAISAVERHGLPSWLAESTHFLVDEFQDFNPSEQRFIEKISQPSDSVVIVGDVDQSIYGGRAASPSGLEALLAKEDVTTVNFVRCRRCPKAIVSGANKILQDIDPAAWEGRQLEPHRADEGSLVVQTMRSCKREVAKLAEYINTWTSRGEKAIALLFPGRKALRFYQEKLEAAGVVCGGPSKDSDELRRIALEIAAGATQPFLERVFLSTYPALERRYGRDVLPLVQRGAGLLEAAKATPQKGWRKDSRDALGEFTADLGKLRSGEVDTILALCSKKGIVVERAVIEEVLQPAEGKTPRERVLDALVGSQEDTVPPPVTRLLTMHSAKGLTVPIVVIPACEDRWMPGAAEGERLEEQKRLFYVALTRAEKGVLITFPETRAKRDPLNHLPEGAREGMSRFAEIVRQ